MRSIPVGQSSSRDGFRTRGVACAIRSCEELRGSFGGVETAVPRIGVLCGRCCPCLWCCTVQLGLASHKPRAARVYWGCVSCGVGVTSSIQPFNNITTWNNNNRHNNGRPTYHTTQCMYGVAVSRAVQSQKVVQSRFNIFAEAVPALALYGTAPSPSSHATHVDQ